MISFMFFRKELFHCSPNVTGRTMQRSSSSVSYKPRNCMMASKKTAWWPTRGARTRYDVIAPLQDSEVEYEVPWTATLRTIPGLPKDKYYRVKLSIDGKDIPLQGKIQTVDKGKNVEFQLSLRHPFKNKMQVCLEIDEYEK